MNRQQIVLIAFVAIMFFMAGIPPACAADTGNDSEPTDSPVTVPAFYGMDAFSVPSESGSTPGLKTLAASPTMMQSAAFGSAAVYEPDTSGLDWQNTIGGSWGDGFFDLQPATDGNFVAAGASGSWDIIDENTGKPVPGYVNQLEAYIVKIDQADGHIIWHKLIGGNGYDGAMSIRQTADGGYIFAGSSDSTDGSFAGLGHGNKDGWVVKLNPDRSIKWQVMLGGSQNEELISIRETPERDGYIVAGYTTSNDIPGAGSYSGSTDMYVAKLGQTGNIIWQKVIGGDKYDFASSAIPASDGGYIVAGYSESRFIGFAANHGYTDIVMVKLDDSGNVVWLKFLGGIQGEATAFDNVIQPTSDGYILIAQSLSSASDDIKGYTHGSGDIWVVKTDNNGNIIWENLLGGTGYDDGTAIRQTTDGSFILVGRTQSDNSGDVGQNNGGFDIWAAKLDSQGKLLWQDALGGSGNEQCTAIQPTADDGFILAALTKSTASGNIGTNHGYEDAWLAKLKPRLVVDVKDSSSNSWVPGVTVFLKEEGIDTELARTANINGRVVFTGSGTEGQTRLENGKKFTIKSIADYYYPSQTKSIQFTKDGQLELLSQQPLISPTNNSFSITCIENYDHLCNNEGICSISGTFDECNNIASGLVEAGYKMNFYHKDEEVTEKDFATDPSYNGHMLTESAFHYHSGHGSAIPDGEGNIVSLIQLKGFFPIDYVTGNNQVNENHVEEKWGGKSKWVAIQSCNILKDEKWAKALTTSHGILGYSTPTGVNSSFSKVFLSYALDKTRKMTIVSAYKQATLDTWYDDKVTAKVITRTKDQYYKDQFPGIGEMAPDAGLKDTNPFIRQWLCRSGVEW